MSFTTVEEVALYTDTPRSLLTPANLAQIGKMILYVDGLINNYCGWSLLETDYTNKRYDGNGLTELDLRVYPVNSVTSCRIRATDGTFTDITSDIEIYEGGVIGIKPNPVNASTFTTGKRNIFVTFNAGFDDVPPDLAYAATHLTALNYNRISQETFDMASEGFDQKTAVYTTIEIPELLRRTLDRYRLVSIF